MLFQLPSHVFVVKVPVTFVKENRIFLNCDRRFLFVSCHFFYLFIREPIEQNIQSNAIWMWLRIFFFSFFPSLRLREFPCEQNSLPTMESLMKNARHICIDFTQTQENEWAFGSTQGLTKKNKQVWMWLLTEELYGNLHNPYFVINTLQ